MPMHDMSAMPLDQAMGLRRLFAGRARRQLALVSNPHDVAGAVVLERLTQVLDTMGHRTLVIDAAEDSPPADELAMIDLRNSIEPLSPSLGYLAACGLPLRHVDTRGSCAHWLDRVQAAAPQYDVLLVHACAADMARLFTHRALRPLLLAGDSPQSLTHAYASLKLLALRCGWMSHDLLISAPPQAIRAPRIAERLASCAERFLGAALHDWTCIDPAGRPGTEANAALARLVRSQLQADEDLPAAPRLQPPRQAALAAAPTI